MSTTTKQHRAIRVQQFGEPDVLTVETVDTPQPTGNQVQVKVHAAGVNPVDTYIRAGTYARKPALPYTPGNDAAGVVVAVGESVSKWKAGDRVWTAGAHSGACSEILIADENSLQLLPESTSFEQGAALNVPYGTAYRAVVQKARAKPGEILFVHGGSGGVGIAAIQIGVAMGLRVVATAGTSDGLALVKQQGAYLAFNHREPNYIDEIKQQTGGVDVVIEMLANVNLDNDMTLLRKGGRIAVVGNRGNIEINPRALMAVDGEILGVAYANTSDQDREQIFAAIVAGLKSKTLSPVVGQTYTLEQTKQAHIDVITPPKGAQGKLVVRTLE